MAPRKEISNEQKARVVIDENKRQRLDFQVEIRSISILSVNGNHSSHIERAAVLWFCFKDSGYCYL